MIARPALVAELMEAAGKAAKLKYNVTCDKPEAAPFILLASPANILELARYIEELEAGRIAARNEALEEVANLYDWPETAKAIRALKFKENEHGA